MSGACWCARTAHQQPVRLVTKLFEQFRRQGGEIVSARALGFRLDGRRLTAISTDQGDLAAMRR